MKRFSKLITFFAFISLLAAGGSIKPSKAMASPVGQEGDTYGGARVSFKEQATSDILAVMEINVGGAGNADYSGDGLFMRIKNNTDIETPINMKLNSTNGTLIGPKKNGRLSYFNSSRVELTEDVLPVTRRGWGNYLMIPANFDGYIYMDYSEQAEVIQGSNPFDPAHIWRIYLDFSAYYDSYTDVIFGDMFTNTKTVLDTSELTTEQFSSTFIVQAGSTKYLSAEQTSRTDDFEPRGDLLGSANITSTVGSGAFHFLTNGASIDNDGFFARVKNNDSNDVSLVSHINSRNNARVTLAAGASFYLYNDQGLEKAAYATNDDGKIIIPANFDGVLNIPLGSYVANTAWSEEVFNANDTYAIYFEGSISDIDVGDIITKTTTLFDGSENYLEQSSALFIVDWDVTISFNEGYLIPVFDYSSVEYIADVDNGVQITCLEDENDTTSTVDIVFPEKVDISSALAITLRVKGISGSFPFYLRIFDEDGNGSQLPSKLNPIQASYVSLDGDVTAAMQGGNENTVYYSEGYEGNLIIPVAALEAFTENKANLASVTKFQLGVAVKYDFYFNAAFGDIGYVLESDSSHHIVLDVSDLTSWASTYLISGGEDFIRIKRYRIPKPCEWIGDVKILNSLNYETDEDLKAEVTWNSGDNACTYHVQDDGMFVHIGPYEVGHTYGSYMALQMPEKGVSTDRTVWSRGEDSEKEYAKGITMYLKNLSFKEIGITLQFDEQATPSATERWCIIGYPAMYYAWDVNTDAEYIFYCKSDQIQIPVGFEGYVRVPFESYRVPEWNQDGEGVDNALDLDKVNGTLFLTSDNTRFEDLEFFIKNVGVYFNETRKGNLFDQSNTIKANMGL